MSRAVGPVSATRTVVEVRDGMTDLSTAWDRVVCWLRVNAPATYQGLNGGATEDSLRELESVVGSPVPEDLKAWLRLNDGCHVRTSAFMPVRYRPLSCAEIAGHWRVLEPSRTEMGDSLDEELATAMAAPAGDETWMWLPQLLPILDTNSIDVAVIDRRRGPLHGCIATFDPAMGLFSPPRWSSLTAMLGEVADVIERGRTPEGWTAVVESGELSWDLP